MIVRSHWEATRFSGNTLSSLYMHTAGEITTLAITASTNTMSNNGGAGLVLATPVNTSLTLVATDNTISGGGDNGIAIISSTLTSTGNITINNTPLQMLEMHQTELL